MIHYHGTPLGGTRDEVARFVLGRHALIPFPRQEDLPIVAEACQSFVFDNGAFTVWKQGGKLDIEGYLAWCEEWHQHPAFDWCLIPDVIDGNEAANDAMLEWWFERADASLAARSVPVYHLHESLERLDGLCATYDRVAIGSSGAWPNPGTQGWWQRMGEVMGVACDAEGKPRCRLHGLRMMNPEIFSRLPLASADSTNVAQNSNLAARFGNYKPPTQSQRGAVIAARIEIHSSAAVWTPSRQELLFDA